MRTALVIAALLAAATPSAVALADDVATAPPVVEAPAKAKVETAADTAEQGEAELQKSVRVFQQRYLVKAGRAELRLGGSTSFNDPWVHHFAADGALAYHINEQWAVGVAGSKWWPSTTDTFNNFQKNFRLYPEKSSLQAGGWAEVLWSPVVGKFTSFGVAVLQVDAYALAGGGVVRTSRGESLKPAGEWGVGLRVHTARWLTLSVEVRNLLFFEKFLPCEKDDACYDTANPEQARSELMKHWFGGIKLGFWIPPSVQYRYQR